MKNRERYWLRASFAALAFVMLGYVVKFYPETLVGFDGTVQVAIRGQLPEGLTTFFRSVTILGDTLTQTILVLVSAIFLYQIRRWKIESFFVAFSGLAAAILILVLKYSYQRSRPLLEQLVLAHGYSFPSGHSTGVFLILGSLLIICHQRLPKGIVRLSVEFCLGSLIVLVGLSRIYLGVHYPTDVLGGFLLAYAVLTAVYPFYDQKRFEWRFQSKQE